MDRGLSEFELIDRLRRQAATTGTLVTGLGDDASVTQDPGPTATSVDAVVEGVHFRREWSDPALIASKAVGAKLGARLTISQERAITACKACPARRVRCATASASPNSCAAHGPNNPQAISCGSPTWSRRSPRRR